MGQVVHVNGDYTIKARSNAISDGREAKITLDTGSTAGEVKVIGNLVVEGSTVVVDTTNLAIEDNIIVLNKNEVGPGVTKEISGIEIDRGTGADPSYNRAAFFFDETDDSWSIGQRLSTISEVEVTASSYSYANTKLKVSSIVTSNNGNLTLIGTGTGVISVGDRNPSNNPLIDNYEDLVLDEDDIPNRKFVLDAIQSQPARQIISDAEGPSPSRLIISDFDAGDLAWNGATLTRTITESEIALYVDNQEMVTFYNDRIEFQDLAITENELGNLNVDQNIVLATQGTGKVEIPYGIEMNQVTSLSLPSPTTGSLNLQARTPSSGTGNAGLWFVHDTDEDELISKRKALVFSMLF